MMTMIRYAVAVLIAAAPVPAQSPEALSSVNSIVRLLGELQDYGGAPIELQKLRTVAFDLPESVVNVYAEHLINTGARYGFKSLHFELLNQNRLLVTFVLDLNQIRSWTARADRYPAGQCQAEISLVSSSGFANLQIRPVAAEERRRRQILAALRLIAEHQPERLDLTRPIRLPFGLAAISISQGALHGSTR